MILFPAPLQLHASEIICILLQAHNNDYTHFLKLNHLAPQFNQQIDHKIDISNGLECLLRILDGIRRRHGVLDEDLIEIMENTFDSICSVLADFQAKEALINAEGIELLILLLKY